MPRISAKMASESDAKRKRSALAVAKKPDIPVQPLFENVLTIREEEEKYSGTLFIPETVKEKPMGAKVVAIGPDVKHVKPGDFVLVGKYAGAECVFRDTHYTILRESEILGIVPGGGK